MSPCLLLKTVSLFAEKHWLGVYFTVFQRGKKHSFHAMFGSLGFAILDLFIKNYWGLFWSILQYFWYIYLFRFFAHIVMIKHSSVSHLCWIKHIFQLSQTVHLHTQIYMKHSNMLLAVFDAVAINFRTWDFSPSVFSIFVTDNANTDTWCSEANACTSK